MKTQIGYPGIVLKALLMLGSVAAVPCLAATIYTDLGPGDSFIINREYDTNFDFMATPFVTTGGGNLGDVVIPLFSLNNPVSLGLYTDSGSQPGTLLEGWSVTVPGFPGILTTIPSVQNPLLSAGTQYWFVISLTSAQKDNLAWYQNSQGLSGGVWLGNSLHALLDFEGGSPIPAIQLDPVGATVPEPAGGLLAVIGLGLLMASSAIRSPNRLGFRG